jgi:hypothetical protein
VHVRYVFRHNTAVFLVILLYYTLHWLYDKHVLATLLQVWSMNASAPRLTGRYTVGRPPA